MLSAFQGRNPFTRVGVYSAGVCWGLLTLGGCGDDGATPSGGSGKPDAGGADAALSQRADAALPPSPSAIVDPSGTHSGGRPVSTVVPTTTRAAMTAEPSTPEPSTPVPSISASSDPLPPESPLEGQSNCQEYFSVTDTGSFYRLVCDPDTLVVECRLVTTEWDCWCQNVTTAKIRSFTLSLDTELEAATRASIALCNGVNAPEVIESGCEEAGQSTGYSCDLGQTCTGTVDLGEGLNALVDTFRSQVSCSGETPGQSQCRCTDPDQGLLVYDVETADACAALASWCESERVVSDDILCAEPTVYVDNEYCSSSRECGRSAQLDDAGNVLAVSESFTRQSSCSRSDDNHSGCSCGPLIGTVEGNIEDACAKMDAMCEPGLPIQPNGALECGSLTVSAAASACGADAFCSQQVSVGSGALLAGATISSACDADGNGGWSCVCSSGDAATLPETLTAPSAIRACTNAIDSCAARGQLERGENGSFSVVFSSELPGPLDAGSVDATVPGDL